MEEKAKVYVAGHEGLVGSALLRSLEKEGHSTVITRSKKDLDLRDVEKVENFFKEEKPEYVFVAAARVGGILANDTYPANFILDNLRIGSNVINAAYLSNVKKLLYLGSSCIYPREAPQPIKEEYFMTGALEPTNEAYATAKIAGIKMCQAYNRQYGTNFISAMPTNQFGPNDNFGLENSHVLPALLRKFVEAKVNNKPTVSVWGSGKPKREFMYVDDLADACIFLMNNYNDSEIVNVGTGEDISISDLAKLIKQVTGYKGLIKYDHTKPDGMPRKWLDVSRLHSLGYKHSVSLEEGLVKTCEWYVNHIKEKEMKVERSMAR
jgi:GDP-L-fucose synthase